MDAFEKVRKALYEVADNKTGDSGSGMGSYDIWAMIDGVEWYINMKPSNKQRSQQN